MNTTYDLVIIGAGPAGTAAAVYAARKQLKTLLVTTEFGGQSVVSETIFNWIGSKAISGSDLAKSFEEHIRDYEGDILKIHKGLVSDVSGEEGFFVVKTQEGDSFETKSVLVGTGSSRRKLTVPGADVFENKGVVYCASCDGPLFSGMDVVVVGGGNAGFESAAQLAAYCKSVTILHRSDAFKADKITIEKVLENDNVTALLNTQPTKVLGEAFVSGVEIKNRVTGESKELAAQGVFVEIGQIPNTTFIKDFVDTDDYNRILIDPWTQRTSKLGVWSAGDATNVRFHQNNISAGDAVKALEDIYLYLKAGR
jgi:alkyl hydroperoxide reductase subunit F